MNACLHDSMTERMNEGGMNEQYIYIYLYIMDEHIHVTRINAIDGIEFIE